MNTNQKQPKPIDYEKLYRNNYKNLPNGYYLAIRILLTIGTIVLGIVFLAEGDDDFIAYGVLTIIGGFFVSWGIAALTRFLMAVGMSRGIVVADSLLTIRDGNSAPTVTEEDLPEL